MRLETCALCLVLKKVYSLNAKSCYKFTIIISPKIGLRVDILRLIITFPGSLNFYVVLMYKLRCKHITAHVWPKVIIAFHRIS